MSKQLSAYELGCGSIQRYDSHSMTSGTDTSLVMWHEHTVYHVEVVVRPAIGNGPRRRSWESFRTLKAAQAWYATQRRAIREGTTHTDQFAVNGQWHSMAEWATMFRDGVYA